jgi:DnaK suppressor protein
MANLTQEQLAQIEQLLNERERALRGDLNRDLSDEDYRTIASEAPDPGDASATRDLAELRSIEAARDRIHKGTYGQCIDCETEIPYERLLAQPTAERCAPCQEMYEKTHADQRRGATM